MVEVVAVIGAGASGLVACRHLVQCGFRPFLLESSSHGVGGAWNTQNGKMWNGLVPNLSRYTQCFSDFPWPPNTPAFPSRAQVQQYMELYAAEHGLVPKCNCRVTNIQPAATTTTESSSTTATTGYRVEWIENEETPVSQTFDKVVIATGFFSDGFVPSNHLEGFGGTVLHSSAYTSPAVFANQTVAVVGAAFSALEIASDLCTHAQRVISVLPSIPWVMPRYVPYEDGSLPLDLALYRHRTHAPQEQTRVMDEAACHARYHALQNLLGTRKQQQAIGLPVNDPSIPSMAVISDRYLDLVLSDKIQVVHGRLQGAADANSIRIVDSTSRSDGDATTSTTSLPVDAVICCTGYRSRLNFLDAKILETLEYDPNDGFLPLTLSWDALHPKLPGLGFVGMYRGVFFGVMELQARLLAQLWSKSRTNHEEERPPPPTQQQLIQDESMTQALEMSKMVRRFEPRAQFPQFDVVGCMDTLAKLVNVVPPSSSLSLQSSGISNSSSSSASKQYAPFGAKGMIVTPSYYQPSLEYSQAAFEDIESQIERGRQGLDMPKIVLSALIGQWAYTRTIRHFNTDREERIAGVIRYTLTGPQLDTVMYREDGVFQLPNGREMDVFREYEYIENDDALEIYFVEGGKRTYLFLGLKFQKKTQGYWEATSDHLCIKDLYRGTFQVFMDGIAASQVTMTYRVKGPNKDYESVTTLTPLL